MATPNIWGNSFVIVSILEYHTLWLIATQECMELKLFVAVDTKHSLMSDDVMRYR